MFNIRNNHRSAGSPVNFDDFLTRDNWLAAEKQLSPQLNVMPATNVVETANEFIIELVAPGLTHKDLDIQIKENNVDVRFEPESGLFESMQRRRDWRSEYRLLPFRRAFDLNGELLDLEAIAVSSHEGLIQINIPKRAAVRGRISPLMPFSLN